MSQNPQTAPGHHNRSGRLRLTLLQAICESKGETVFEQRAMTKQGDSPLMRLCVWTGAQSEEPISAGAVTHRTEGARCCRHLSMSLLSAGLSVMQEHRAPTGCWRDGERERETEREKEGCVGVCVCVGGETTVIRLGKKEHLNVALLNVIPQMCCKYLIWAMCYCMM